MSTTATEPKKESLGISAALILSLIGLTLVLVIGVLIKREIRRGNAKSKRDGHFWSCNFFRKCVQAKLAKEEQVVDKVKPQWLLAGHHELPEHYYTTNECPQYIARMFTIDLYTVLQYSCREVFSDYESSASVESYLLPRYPSLADPMQAFRRLKIRAEIDLVPFTIDDAKLAVDMFNDILQKLSELVKNPYLCQRQIDLFSRTDLEQRRMSSDYVPLLPKDLCHIPLQSIDDEALRNIKKRSRLKDRFPFQLPSFIHKHRFFTSRSIEKNQQEVPTVSRISQENVQSEHQPRKSNRHRLKRQVATDVSLLVESQDNAAPNE